MFSPSAPVEEWFGKGKSQCLTASTTIKIGILTEINFKKHCHGRF